ncbi:hypothetical protein BS78_03G318100 [Paspalum vaginatum]|nr:hypothetical protein BS78_03G318100 [Paspalum vaginatum]
MALARVWPSSSARLLPCPLLQSILRPFSSSASHLCTSRRRSSPIAAAFSQASLSPHTVSEGQVMEATSPSSRRPWKPTCLYYTQGKCTMMNDAMHIEKFSHNLTEDLPVSASATDKVKPQKLDYFFILDLEGKVEILEFPIIMIDAQSMEFVDSFHRFVRPTTMSEQRTTEYIAGKYGKLGLDRVWHDTAIPFKEVLQQLEEWIGNHNLWKKEHAGSLNSAAFVTCGNWDLKTKVPDQCKVSKIKLPTYFMEWINLKDIYLNFYRRRVIKLHPWRHGPCNWNDDYDEGASNANHWKPPSRDRRFKKYSKSGSAHAC